jgi:hypothetical protein
MRQVLFQKVSNRSLHIVYCSAIFCLLTLCSILIISPQSAHRANSFVFKDHTDPLDMLLLAERDIDLSNYPSHIRTVSSEMHSTLPFIEEDKSYIIHRVRNRDDRAVFYISEIRKTQQFSKLY